METIRTETCVACNRMFSFSTIEWGDDPRAAGDTDSSISGKGHQEMTLEMSSELVMSIIFPKTRDHGIKASDVASWKRLTRALTSLAYKENEPTVVIDLAIRAVQQYRHRAAPILHCILLAWPDWLLKEPPEQFRERFPLLAQAMWIFMLSLNPAKDTRDRRFGIKELRKLIKRTHGSLLNKNSHFTLFEHVMEELDANKGEVPYLDLIGMMMALSSQTVWFERNLVWDFLIAYLLDWKRKTIAACNAAVLLASLLKFHEDMKPLNVWEVYVPVFLILSKQAGEVPYDLRLRVCELLVAIAKLTQQKQLVHKVAAWDKQPAGFAELAGLMDSWADRTVGSDRQQLK